MPVYDSCLPQVQEQRVLTQQHASYGSCVGCCVAQATVHGAAQTLELLVQVLETNAVSQASRIAALYLAFYTH